jgi:hypothetical protein
MSINQDILSKLLVGLKKIQNQSYPLCDDPDNDISSRNIIINKEARNLQVMLEYFFKDDTKPDNY